MPTITVLPHRELCPAGMRLEAAAGDSLAERLLAAGVAIEHACDLVGACATCHVHVREGAHTLAAPDEDEEDELDQAWGIDAQSRLACRVRVGQGELAVELPRHSRNHARER
ncbi:2Fe-2S iron-sulfur cluster-binding protein [Caldimonas tepidiphila]|uniref:2Fe-2S iron-sulfur cluster-binding protein n=1 Tax=Caldimonas tepidiphila TaxID=2315841 RepID=UPI000E5BC9E2|nr:2Fe-2S iron-sulfur cluster-binding protein [Caldimonas tepidiphila]